MNKYKYHLIRLAAKYSSPALSLTEKILLNKKESSINHPIFIIGAPRTGSTFLYQILTNSQEVLYINNFIALFHRNLYSGFLLNEYCLKDTSSHNSFTSEYGNTFKDGWKAPSEAGNFWYNWLDRSNDYLRNNTLSEKKIIKLKNLLNHIMNRFNKPILFKNLYNSQRLPLIYNIDPQSKVIWMRRDPIFTAQSILLARRKHCIMEHEIWSIKPHDLNLETCKNEYELVVKQIHLLEKQIASDLHQFPSENILKVNYNNLENEIRNIFVFCGIKNTPTRLDEFKLSDKQILHHNDWEGLKNEINKLHWE